MTSEERVLLREKKKARLQKEKELENSSDQDQDDQDETRLTRAQRRRGLGKLDAVVDKLQDTKSEDSA